MDRDGSFAYYSAKDEWSRLELPAGKLEFRRALQLIERHLPADGRILDLGGGPGRYAIALAQRGCRVCLADLSPRQLDEARRHIVEEGLLDRVESIDEVDAVDLSRYDDASFDGVLAMGPFYHLMNRTDRLRAARELRRVLKRRARAVIAFIPRLWAAAALIDRAAGTPSQVPVTVFREALHQGVFRNTCPSAFSGFFADPYEFRQLLAEAGLLWVETVSLRGIADRYEGALWELEDSSPELFQEVLETVDATAGDPSVIASCGHAIIVAQRPVLPV